MSAFEQGYNTYSEGKGTTYNPYDFNKERELFEQWCEGHMKAYCEAEGK